MDGIDAWKDIYTFGFICDIKDLFYILVNKIKQMTKYNLELKGSKEICHLIL